jgi:hypothetical protein
VTSGTYAESLEWSRGGTASSPISIAAAPGARATITGRVKIWADYVRLSGFRLLGRSGLNRDEVVVYIAGGRAIEISGNEITRAARSGVFVGGGASDIQLIGNWIHHNGVREDLDHGIYWHTGNGLIANNVIEANRAFGVHLYPNADDVVVTSNTIVYNGRSGIIVAGDSRATSDRNLLVANILAFNAEFGIRTYWSAAVGTGNTAQANLGHRNAEGDFATGSKARGIVMSDSVIAAPSFVSRAVSNYRLKSGSPARDRALPEFALMVDYDGKPRPVGSAPDIGAFEYSALGNASARARVARRT